ncbi:MAG: hypothetical protein ACJA2W_001186 [Planctomycetota bacterium]
MELGDPSGSSGEFKTPAFEFHDDGMGLDVSWPIAGRRGAQGAGATYTMRLTLPCRPVGELTFSNDELDTEVWLCATRDGRMAARMRPYSAHPELEIVPGSGTLEFERSPDWRLGLEVMDPDGTVRVEDRFSPGTFVLRIPEGENRVQLSIRIVAPNAAERGRRGGALGALLGHVGSPAGQPVGAPKSGQAAKLTPDELRLTAMSLPGDLMRRGVRSFDAESELRDLLLEAAPHVNGPRFDVALWAARAAFLIHPGATRDVTSVTLPFLRGVVGRIERDLVSTGCPGAAAAGLPRWCHLPSILGGAELGGGSELGGGAELGGGSGPGTAPEMDTEINAGTSGEIAVEHAALLHQCCQHAADLAIASGDARFARRARRLARSLRRWFQDEYWLSRPERAADLAFVDAAAAPMGSPPRSAKARWDRVRALCLRPHMILAASFEGAPLSTAQRRLIVRVTEARLLVPGLGIATLDCDDIEFDGHSGENGAIWPFLIGPFIEASLRAFGPDRGRHRMLSGLLNSQVLKTEPMAWAHSAGATTSPEPYRSLEPVHSGRHPMPLGPLTLTLNAAEEVRAKRLLTEGLPSPSAIAPRMGPSL